jgi:hypothetical protein
MDDFDPYIFRTDDYGGNWQLLTDGSNGIPAGFPTRSLQEDPARKGLLYAGTEFGLFVSFDDGVHWQPLQQNLPISPVMDLLVHQNDLIVATQGRAIWILDDLTPLHQIDRQVGHAGAFLFKPRDTYKVRQQSTGRGGDWPENPPDGAMVYYYLAESTSGEVRLEIADATGAIVREYTSASIGAPDVVTQDLPLGAVTRLGEEQLDRSAGMHRLIWDLKYAPAYLAPGVNEGLRERIAVVTGYTGGPHALPGTYSVTLSVGDNPVHTQSFDVLQDPRLSTTMAELQETFDLSVRLRDRITAMQVGIARGQAKLDELQRTIDAGGSGAAAAVGEKEALELVLGELYKHGEKGDHAHLHPELTTDYARIYTMIAGSDYRPAASAYPRLEELEVEFADLMGQLRAILERPIT